MIKIIKTSLLLLSIFLLGLNFYGLYFGEYEQSENNTWGMGTNDRVISHLKKEDLNKLEYETDATYFNRITKLINGYIIHGPSNITALWDNYFIWVYDLLNPEKEYFNENYNLQRSLNKGKGLCSQHAKIIYSVLTANNYESRIVRLYGHVVTSVQDKGGKWYISDADYGILIPFSLDELENDVDILSSYYEPIYQNVPADVHLSMEDLYGSSENNRLMNPRINEGWKAYYFEIVSDYLKWPFPLAILIFLLWTEKKYLGLVKR